MSNKSLPPHQAAFPVTRSGPSRRSVLRGLGLVAIALPLGQRGLKMMASAWRRQRLRHPKDLPPIAWFGHC